jgi:acetyl esterase/lipase
MSKPICKPIRSFFGKGFTACIWTRAGAMLVLLAQTACSPITILNALSGNPATVRAGVSYGDDPRQKLDIYTPPGVVLPPVVVFFYGGSWSSGSREEYRFVGNALASRGIMAVIADYRVYPQVTYPAFVRDSARAVAWTLRHIDGYGGDAHRLFVAGHSAGAYNAAMVMLDPRWLAEFGASPAMLRGWIGIAGPYDFLPIGDVAVKPVFHFPNSPPDSQPLAHAADVTHAGGSAPPALLLSGTADTTVDPIRNSDRLAAALQAAHVDVKGIGHAMLAGAFGHPLQWVAPVLDDVAGFVQNPPSFPLAFNPLQPADIAGK